MRSVAPTRCRRSACSPATGRIPSSTRRRLAFLRPGDEVLVPQITFDLYRTVALTKGAAVTEVPMPDLQLAVEAIVERITPRTRIVFICNPNNPTGALFPRPAMERLLAALPDRVVLVHDEVYREFADDDLFPRPGVPGQRRAGQSDPGAQHGQGLRSGRCAVRIRNHGPGHRGAAAPRPPAVHDTSILAQAAALGALDDAEFLERTLALNRRGKRQLYAACARLGLATRTVTRQLRAGGRGAGRTRRGTGACCSRG